MNFNNFNNSNFQNIPKIDTFKNFDLLSHGVSVAKKREIMIYKLRAKQDSKN